VKSEILGATSQSFHLHKAVGQNTATGRGTASNDVKDTVSLLDIVARVPGADKEDTSGEEARLKDTQDQSEADHLSPGLREAKANFHNSPEECNSGEEVSGANLAAENGGRWLTHDIGDEEDEGNGRVAETNEVQVPSHAGDDCGTKIGSVHQ
jgi:hypothetical protein